MCLGRGSDRFVETTHEKLKETIVEVLAEGISVFEYFLHFQRGHGDLLIDFDALGC